MKNNEGVNYLRRLGLTREEAMIYVGLYEKGTSTPLALSRLTKINRTKVYRTLERMRKKKLVEEVVEEYSTHYSPAPLARIKEILKSKQARLAELSQSYEEFEEVLVQSEAERGSDTRVKFYRGESGVSQMIWNELKAEREIVGYSFRVIETVMGEKLANEFYEEFVARKLSIRDLYGEEFERSLKETGGRRVPAHENPEREKRVKSRFISEKVLPIPMQMDIYNEVVSMYSWHEGEVFGVEIKNVKVAELQRALFEMAWEKAKKV